MQFGTELIQCPTRPDRDGWNLLFKNSELLEELGFDFASLSHHRFTEGYFPSPWTVLAAVALRTSKLRIGSGVISLPLHHPADLAEQVATVDQLTGGRIFLGVGVGYRRYEYEALGIPFSERGSRMEESLDILRRIWTEDSVSYSGRYYQLEDMTVYPKPFHPQGPEIWVGANLMPAIDRAGRLGDAWYGGSIESLRQLGPALAYYRKVAAANGRRSHVVLKRSFAISTDATELEKNWLPGMLHFRERNIAAGIDWIRDPEFEQMLEDNPDPSLESVALDHGVVGNPDECIRAIERCREMTGCESIHLALAQQARSPEAHEAQLRMFAKEVMPAFKSA
jgi:probable F420-dependent oxidoreductase